MTEAERDELAYRHVEFRQKFIEDREQCASKGRTIIVIGDYARIDKDGVPKEPVRYYCE